MSIKQHWDIILIRLSVIMFIILFWWGVVSIII